MSKTIQEMIFSFQKENKPFFVVTLVNTLGSAPQEIGAKILVGLDGYLGGTVGGGKVEERVIAHAKELLTKMHLKFDYQSWNLQTDIGMTCGGVVTFFFEKIEVKPSWEIAVFGAGHVAQEVVRLLLKLECHIICTDPRIEWLDKLPEHHNLKKIHTEQMKDVVETLNPGTFIASMTMGHAYDLPILIAAMKKNIFPYLGVIGSASKSIVLKNDLKKNGCNEALIEKLHCPIGETFGNNTPAEIALSIVAQLIISRDSLKKG